MSDHFVDVTNMVSDTPRTDAAYFEPGATMYDLAGEAKRVERELNAANDRIKQLIAERDTARLQADQKVSLREEFESLLGTDKIEEGVAAVTAMKDRIKRLEEAGKNLRECAGWLGYAASQYGNNILRAKAAIEAWGKETKP